MAHSLGELKEILENDESNKKRNTQKWSGFVESTVVNFFDEYKLEKILIEDGNGNKAKISRTKDNGIKIEYSSIVMM